MKRFLLLSAFLGIGMTLLVFFGGGMAGPGTRDTAPSVTTTRRTRPTSEGLVPSHDFPGRVHAFEETSIPAPPEPYRYVDARTGEAVLIPDYIPWFLYLKSGTPIASEKTGQQALEARDFQLITWRKPKTLDEAHALARGVEGARESMPKWVVNSPRALVDGLGLTALEANPGGADTVVELDGGVRLVDAERQTVVESESLLIWPHADHARTSDHVVVRHETFELTGEGIDLSRDGDVTRIEILRDALLHLYGGVPGDDSEPAIDLGSRDMVPGHISAEGGAVLIHRASQSGEGERLTIELKQNVHAEQEGNRSLDAERVLVEAFTVEPPKRADAPPREPGSRKPWRVESFDADGGVIIEYPGQTEEGSPYLLSASARHLLHQVAPDGTATTLLEGDPEFTLRGEFPGGDLQRLEGPGFLRATAREQAWLGPATPSDLPPGADRDAYRRVILRGDAKVESRAAGMDPARDTLEGEQMILLLKEVEEPIEPEHPGAPPQTRTRNVAVSFAVLRDVRIGGTRMSGMTHHLLAEGLDTESPVLVAEGPGTSFAFHGLRPGERLVGGSAQEGPPRDDAPGGGADPAEGKDEWLLERLLARDSVVVETSLGGAGLGLPARLEAEELTYDRISDRARVSAASGGRTRLTLGEHADARHELLARTMQLDRARGEVQADGSVEATVFLSAKRGKTSSMGDSLTLPQQRTASAATLGVATNGRITIRSRVSRSPLEPLVGAEQVLTIEGELVAELTASTLEVDRLRAHYLRVSMTRSTLPAGAVASAPSARVATGGGSSIGGDILQDSPADPQAPSRWDLTSNQLLARFGGDGFKSLEASGGVRLWSEEAEIRGSAFTYDAQARRIRVLGGGREHAWAAFGPPEERSEVHARELALQLGDAGPERLHALRPSVATLIRTVSGKPGAVERFLVACEGDVEMTSTAFTTHGFVEIRRHIRDEPGGRWGSPFRLWSDQVVVRGENLLAREAGNVRTLTATGPRTTLRSGEGSETTTVWGERFELDVATSLATLEGGPGSDLRFRRGLDADPETESEQVRIVIDLNTNMIHDWESPRLIYRGGRAPR